MDLEGFDMQQKICDHNDVFVKPYERRCDQLQTKE